MPPTTPQAGEPQPLKGQKKPVGHALWLKCTRCWEDQPCGAIQICSTQLRTRFYRRIKRRTAPACRALGGTLPGPPAQGGTWPQQGLRLGGTAGLAPQPELRWEQKRQPIHGAVTPEPPPASRGPTCPQMTHAEIRSIADRKPCVNLIQHLSWLTGQSPPGYPRGQCAPHSHRWDSNPRSCRNAGPLSPLKQVAGPASAEERLGGGFSSPRSGVTLKCSHSNRWTHALPCSNRPTSKKGIYPTRTEQLLARGPAAEAAGHLVSHPSGQCACARVCTCREGHATVP